MNVLEGLRTTNAPTRRERVGKGCAHSNSASQKRHPRPDPDPNGQRAYERADQADGQADPDRAEKGVEEAQYGHSKHPGGEWRVANQHHCPSGRQGTKNPAGRAHERGWAGENVGGRVRTRVGG